MPEFPHLTAPAGGDADLASAEVWSQLIDISGNPHEQARRLLSLLFPGEIAESTYREFGDIVATARAQLSPGIVNRQVAAMDAWHCTGIRGDLREMNVPVLIATGMADVVIPPSNALRLVNAIPCAWAGSVQRRPRFHGAVSASARRSYQ
jgi:pimeloyl-ACP methyl ester carboxylesterase